MFAGISCICIVGGYFFIDADKATTEKNGRVDWIGAFLVTSGLTLLTVVLSQGEAAPKQWATPCATSLHELLPHYLHLTHRYNRPHDIRGNLHGNLLHVASTLGENSK